MKRTLVALLLVASAALADDKPTGFWFAGGGAIFTGGSHQDMGYGPSVEAGIFLPPLETRMFLSTGFQMHINSVTLLDSVWDPIHENYVRRERSASIKEIPIMVGVGTQPHKSRWFMKLGAGLHILLLSGLPETEPTMQWDMGLKTSAGYSWGNGLFLELGGGYIFDSNYGYVYPFARAGFLVAKGD